MTTKLFIQAIAKFLLGVVLVGALIFWPAGTLAYMNGWILMGILFVPMFGAGLVMMAKNPYLLQKRLDAKEKQKEQDKFLDRVFDSIPDSCKILLKKFYWDHKPMSEIASILGMQNADSVKTKKNRCMDKFKEIAKKLVANDEFAEEVVRASVERAALRELLNAERTYASADLSIAACKVEDEPKEDKE